MTITIQELLRSCDKEKLLESWLESDRKQYEYLHNEPLPQEKEAAARINLSEFIDMLGGLKLPSEPSEDIMVATRYWEDGEPRICCNLYKKEELEAAAKKMKDLDIPDTDDISPDETTEFYQSICDKMFKTGVQSYGFEFSPWEDTLGAEVYMDSVEHFGVIPFLLDALEEYSFNGLTREHQQERRDELDASIKELDEILKLPEEEQKKHLHSIDDLFDDLRDEFDLSEPSEEEKKENTRRMYYDSARTHAELYKVLQKMM